VSRHRGPTRTPRALSLVSVAVASVGLLGGCVVAGAGYDTDVGVGYVGGFYEPYPYDWGGWGPNYHVGPPRGGERSGERGGHFGGGGFQHSAPGRSIPIIPHGGGSRGGSHGGDSHGGPHH